MIIVGKRSRNTRKPFRRGEFVYLGKDGTFTRIQKQYRGQRSLLIGIAISEENKLVKVALASPLEVQVLPARQIINMGED